MSTQPNILVSKSDFIVLSHLAAAGSGSAEELQIELERAQVVEDEALPPNVVRMGSTVGYTVDGEDPKTVTIAYPAEADIAAGRVSVLTPIGTALIGLAPGQSIEWSTRDGRVRKLTVVTVFSGLGRDPVLEPMRKPYIVRDKPDDSGPSAA